MKPRFCISAGLCFILSAGSLLSQITGGSIVGSVTDPGGAVVANAAVEAKNVETNAVTKTVTNGVGSYAFPLLPVGEYVLTVEATGFQRALTGGIRLHAGTKPRIDIKMVLGQVSQSVEVIAEAPLVNATTTELGVVIDSKKMRDMPLNGRDFKQLMSLQPGWNTGGFAANRGGVEVNGTPGLGSNFMLDGVDMSFGETNGVGLGAAGASGTRINTVSVEAIEEFKTTSGAFDAEYGHSIGAVINLVTGSGTNNFHGTLFHFFRNDKLDANTFFSNRSGLKKPTLRHNQYGGNLGGPILRNKLFFFFNYEGAKVRQERVLSGNIPTPLMISQLTNEQMRQDFTELFPKTFEPTSNPLIGLHRRNDRSTADEMTTLSRLDANLGNHRLGFRMAYNEQTATNPFVLPSIRQILPVPLKNFQGSDFYMISPTMSNEVRFGYNHYPVARHTEAVNPEDNVVEDGLPPRPKKQVAVRSPAFSFYTYDLTALDTPTQTVNDNLTWIHGAHSFKTGIEIRRINGKRTQFGQGAWENYNTLDDVINDRIYSLELAFGNPGKGLGLWSFAEYFQDTWKINRRVQLHLGLRHEYYTVFSGPIGLKTTDPYGPVTELDEPLFKPRRTNFGPRAGLVVDLTGKGTTILRTGAGISYTPAQPLTYYDCAWLGSQIPAFPTVLVVDLPPSLQPVTYPFPNEYLEAVREDPSKAPPGLAAGRTVPNPERKDEHLEAWNLSLQHAFTSSFALQATYVGNRALNLSTNQNFNLIDPVTRRRPRPELGPIWYIENAGSSWYHALQISANHRLRNGYSFDAYYTWSKTMQYHGATAPFSGDYFSQDPNNFRGSIGPNQGNVGHRLVVVHSYEVPTMSFVQTSTLGKAVLGGWTVQGILGARGGISNNVILGTDAVGNGICGSVCRPDAVQGVSPYVDGPNPLAFLNRAAYNAADPIAEKRFGNLGYNTVVGPGAFTWDLAIHKSFAIREGHRITFRLEMFNWMNHVVFSDPSVTLSDPNFGLITGGSGGRNIQFALKYMF